MRSKRAAVAALLLSALQSLFPIGAAAQDDYSRLVREYDRPRIFHEVVVLAGARSAQVLVSFRIPNEVLVFVREEDRFVAHPEITIGIYQDGVKVDERIWRGAHTAESFEATRDGGRDVEGLVVFEVPPGRYAYTLSPADGVAASIGAARRNAFDVPGFDAGRPGTPFFGEVSGPPSGPPKISFTNLGGDAPFGASVRMLVPFGSPIELVYRLYRLPDGSDATADPADIETGDDIVRAGKAGDAMAIGDVQAECACWNGPSRGVIFPIDLETDQLPNGSYVLELQTPDGSAFRHVFSTLWRDMPLSLFDIEAAIRNLEFIEPRARVRALLRGDRQERIARFEAYWAQRDPSAETPFNELMAEYYERVDTAARRFQTGRTAYPDGLRTDAARIFIVHGPPADVANSFPSTGGVVQVWTYPDGRRFIFQAASSLDPLQLRDDVRSGATGPP